MDKNELKVRTKRFALDVMKFTDTLPRGRSLDIICRQLVRSACSVGANYRAACRAKSTADFVSKLAVVLEEIDESHYWLELLAESELVLIVKSKALLDEANEITSIFASALKTCKAKLKGQKS